VQVPADEFKACVSRLHAGRRPGPNNRIVRTVPTQKHSASRRRVSQAVRVHAHDFASLIQGHPPAI
jgi:hypothetical protein